MTSRRWIPGCAAAIALTLPWLGFQAADLHGEWSSRASALAEMNSAMSTGLLESLDRAIVMGRFPGRASLSLDPSQVWSVASNH